MNAQLTDLIHRYLGAAHRVVQQLRYVHGTLDLLSAYWSGKLPKTGQLSRKPGDLYNFHGLGCFFSLDTDRIDVDFLPGENAIGFDGWRLSRFASETLGLEKVELKDVEEELAQAVSRGELLRKGHLYFLTSTDQANATIPQNYVNPALPQ
jgi:hypothetical protein